MATLDLLGRRWALRIVWELRDGPLTARTLLGRCDEMSSSVLYDRLRELRDAGVIVRSEESTYGLTARGAQVAQALAPLDEWSRTWAAEDAG